MIKIKFDVSAHKYCYNWKFDDQINLYFNEMLQICCEDPQTSVHTVEIISIISSQLLYLKKNCFKFSKKFLNSVYQTRSF